MRVKNIPSAKLRKSFFRKEAEELLEDDQNLNSSHALLWNRKNKIGNNVITTASKIEQPADHIVYADGASAGNGRKTALAGYGVFWGDGDPRNEGGPLPGPRQTNQRAELLAVIRALEQAQDIAGILEIRTDSQYVINAADSWSKIWLKNKWRSSSGKQVQNRDLIERLLALRDTRVGATRFVYVPGHRGIHGNEMADKFAVKGAKLKKNSSINYIKDSPGYLDALNKPMSARLTPFWGTLSTSPTLNLSQKESFLNFWRERALKSKVPELRIPIPESPSVMPTATKTFYAVKRGRQPGVYLSWTACHQQVKDFSGAKYREFPTREEAEEFVKDDEILFSTPAVFPNEKNKSGNKERIKPTLYVSQLKSFFNFWRERALKWYSELPETNLLQLRFCTFESVSGMPKATKSFYAVKHGRRPGVYLSWTACHQQVKDFSGAVFRKFSTREEAEQFVKSNNFVTTTNGNTQPADHIVYTDGASAGNGRKTALAGYGVFWGDGDPRNEGGPLPGPRQTNQRAELLAVIRALEQAQETAGILEIRTDSQYVINAADNWSKTWLKNKWRSSSGKEVENRDLIERLLALRATRIGATRFVYVPGHSGVYGNEMADKLAVEGAKRHATNP